MCRPRLLLVHAAFTGQRLQVPATARYSTTWGRLFSEKRHQELSLRTAIAVMDGIIGARQLVHNSQCVALSQREEWRHGYGRPRWP